MIYHGYYSRSRGDQDLLFLRLQNFWNRDWYLEYSSNSQVNKRRQESVFEDHLDLINYITKFQFYFVSYKNQINHKNKVYPYLLNLKLQIFKKNSETYIAQFPKSNSKQDFILFKKMYWTFYNKSQIYNQCSSHKKLSSWFAHKELKIFGLTSHSTSHSTVLFRIIPSIEIVPVGSIWTLMFSCLTLHEEH